MPTTRSLSQVIFNHLPGSLLFDEEQRLLGKVSAVEGTLDSLVDAERLVTRVRVEIDRWKQGEHGQGGAVSYEVGFLQPRDVELVRPEAVEWEVFPFYFRCTNPACGVWHYRKELLEHEGHCKRCKAPLEQTPFVWVHHCGYIAPLVPGAKAHCRKHSQSALYLHDTGRFASSSWRCRDCGHQAPVGFLQCPQCRSTDPRPQPMKWNDPGVYSSVTFQMINLSEEKRQILLSGPEWEAALLDAMLCRLPSGVGAVVDRASAATRKCSKCGASAARQAKFCADCGKPLPPASVDTTPACGVVGLPQTVIEDLTTYSLLWDMPGTVSLASCEWWKAAERFGTADLVFLQSLPVTLVGLGYRRQRSKQPATLCLFPAVAPTKTMRVYVVSSEVEACALRLDANAVLEWLETNGVLARDTKEAPDASDSTQLIDLQTIMADNPNVAQVVTGLLHTVSHAYVIGLSWCSGMDLASFSEELLPGALTTIVHAGETSLGGLSSVYAQTPWQPLELAAGDLVACQLDPSCTDDDGGACVACLHLPHGCTRWNSDLSRAYLFGGTTKEGHVISQGFWTQ